MCVHVRDAATGAPVDVQEHPYFSQVLGGTPKIPMAPRLTYADEPGYFTTQCAHYPDVAFVPWMLTDDPYLLEECQFNCVYHAQESDYHQGNNKLPGMAQPSETRGWAWGIRDISRMAAFSPESPPSWLLPRAAWEANLGDCLTYANNYLNSQTPSCTVFGLMTQGNVLSPWMIGYHASVVGWMRWTGLFPDWDDVADYVFKPIIGLAGDPRDGWDRRWPSPYQVNVLGLRETTPEKASPLNSDPQFRPSAKDATTPTSFKECWELYQVWCNAQNHTVALDPSLWTEDKVYETAADFPYQSNVGAPSGPHYIEIQRGCLALAAMCEEPGAAEAHEWLASRMPQVYAEYNNPPPAYRYAFWV